MGEVKSIAKMTVMAAEEALEPGTTVQCITCFDEHITGEVAAWDFTKKCMILSKFC